MNPNKIFCRQQDHQQFQVNHICIYRWCSKSRWCCSLCLSEKIHDHPISKNHIINLAEDPDRVKCDIENRKKDYINSEQVILIKTLLSNLVKSTQKLESNIVQLRQDFERYLNNLISDDDNFKLQQLINQVKGQYFLQINDEDINKLININEYRFLTYVQLQLQDNLDKIEKKLTQYQNINQMSQSINQSNNKNYEILQIPQILGQFDSIQSSAITQKENLIQIYDIKMNKTYKRIKQIRFLSSLQFTSDSKYLFAGGWGCVHGYLALKGFKKFYKQKIHKDLIIKIIIQKQYLITASFDQTIVKTDFIRKMQIFKLHSKDVFSIDYDIQKDIIMYTQSDKSIKVWDCANQSILIDYTDNTDYQQIQFMNNKQDIICNTDKKLWKFTIDYQNKKFAKFQLYKDENQILSFQQVNNDQILVICEQYTKILNKNMELTHIFQHTIKLQNIESNIHLLQQLDNLNYIILQDCK